MIIQWEGLQPIQGEVVIVEDDPTLRQLMVDIVDQLGACCIGFDNAEDALVHMLNPAIGCVLVIADHGVPGSIKGMELATMVQQKWPGTGFVLTSGYLLDVSGLPPPLVYLLKPWSIDDLVVAIAQTLQPGIAIHKVGLMPMYPADELELPFTPPFDWARMLRFFGGRSTGGVETVDSDRYIRTLHWQGAPGLLTVRKDPTRPCLIARVEGEASQHLAQMAPRLGHLFDLHTNPQHIREAFEPDPWLRTLIAQAPGLRIPGAWSGFELVVRTIVGQQVSVKAATTIVGRLVQRAGAPAQAPFHPDTAWLFPTPAALADANLDKIGMPGKRVETLQAFARAVAEGALDIDAQAPDIPTLRKGLLAMKGIGPWTVEYVAMRAWRDADAWPGTDLVLMQAIARREAKLDTETWRPWRAYAAMHLWNEIADSAGMAKGG